MARRAREAVPSKRGMWKTDIAKVTRRKVPALLPVAARIITVVKETCQWQGRKLGSIKLGQKSI